MSTKTLTSKYQASNNLMPTPPPEFPSMCFKTDKLHPVQGSAHAFSAKTLLSTKSLQPDNDDYHGSDAVQDGVIDLTKLDQNNVDCYEHCDRVQCPLYKKLFFTANSQGQVGICPVCREGKKGGECFPVVDESDKLSGVDGTMKTVDFALGSKENSSSVNARSDQELRSKGQEVRSRSVTSTKTLLITEAQELRRLSRGMTDLSHQHKISEEVVTRELTDSNLLLPSRQQTLEKCSNMIYLCDENVSDISQICSQGLPVSSKNQTESVKRGNNLCFAHECSEEVLNKTVPQEAEIPSTEKGHCQTRTCPYVSLSEPDIQKFALDYEPKKGMCSKKPLQVSRDAKRSTQGKQPIKNKDSFKKFSDKSPPESIKGNEVYARFDQDNDSSALFRQVFSVDGVGLECQCCISSFKGLNEK